MIISCPECSAKFMVENEQFGENARKVRCGKCAHVWSQEPATEEQIGLERAVRKEQKDNLAQAYAAEKAGIEPNLPVVHKEKSTKWLKVACWILFAFNVFAFFVFNKPMIGQTSFYDMIGNYDTAGIKIQDIKFNEPNQSKDKVTYYFDWAVKNARQNAMKVPHAQLSLLDKNKDLIFTTGPAETGKVLEKQGEYIFRSNKLVDETKQGRYVVIDIGNPYEIGTR